MKKTLCGFLRISMKLYFVVFVFLFSGAAFFTSYTARAQFMDHSDGMNDRLYASVATIFSGDPDPRGAGYAIASTAVNLMSGLKREGEISRTKPDGSIIWANHYQSSADVRFTHIEKFEEGGRVFYLLVGSLKSGTLDRMLVAIMDDNGSVMMSNEFYSSYPHLLGIRGIRLSDGNFAVVGVESNGFLPVYDRNIVVTKLDRFLGIISSYAYSTKKGSYDFDSPNAIVEGASPDELFVTGTCNPDGSLLNALLDMGSGNVMWNYNMTTGAGHYDAGVDAFYDPSGSGSIYALGNTSIGHNMVLTRFDYVTGMPLSHFRFSPGGEYYGNTIRPSLTGPGRCVIAGWQRVLNGIQPFMLEHEEATNTVVWSQTYPSTGNSLSAYNENDWLKRLPIGQFGFYFNNIMDYRFDRNGYVLLGATNAISGNNDLRFWNSIGITGTNYCGTSALSFTSYMSSMSPNLDLDPVPHSLSSNWAPLHPVPVSYMEYRCLQSKPATGVGDIDVPVERLKAYPNPAYDELAIEYDFDDRAATNIIILDALGRQVYVKTLGDAKGRALVSTRSWPEGIYAIYIEKSDGRSRALNILVRH